MESAVSEKIFGGTSKDNSKALEVQKPDYIHVRARRGQATDSIVYQKGYVGKDQFC